MSQPQLGCDMERYKGSGRSEGEGEFLHRLFILFFEIHKTVSKMSAPTNDDKVALLVNSRFECTLNIRGRNIAGLRIVTDILPTPTKPTKEEPTLNQGSDDNSGGDDSGDEGGVFTGLVNSGSAGGGCHRTAEKDKLENGAISYKSKNADPTGTTLHSSTPKIPSSILLTFDNNDIITQDRVKMEAFIRALHAGSDKWEITLCEDNHPSCPAEIGSLATVHDHNVYNDDHAKGDIEELLDYLRKLDCTKQWKVIWEPSDPIRAVGEIKSLDQSIK
jgi:hypothetical protein